MLRLNLSKAQYSCTFGVDAELMRVNTDSIGYSDTLRKWQKCHCNQLSLLAEVFYYYSFGFVTAQSVTISGCHCKRCHCNRLGL